MVTRIAFLLLVLCGINAAQPPVEIGRITRVLRKPNVRVFGLKDSTSVRAILYTVETANKTYVAMDIGKKYFGKGYPQQVFRKGDRVQVRAETVSIELAPVEGGTWERMEIDSEEDKQ